MNSVAIFIKIVLYLLSLIGVFYLNIFYHNLKKNKEPFLRIDLSLKEFNSENRIYDYLIITIPNFAIWIRCVYSDLSVDSYGISVAAYQLLFYFGVYLYLKKINNYDKK